ncbi:MAG: bifunctional diaminohydroxyphosphoribosylaminopyrimidine deaminase/5-amino-6-(5-phosphoribosylamino)uracil reductase RibD [Actinomycetes bacterium]
MDTATDEYHMSQAVSAAAAVRRSVSPRPWVGAVVVPDTSITRPNSDVSIFAGATQGRLGAHAEIAALGSAGKYARGSTLYTTLEPCSHDGQTGPCADAIIDAEVARVVIGVQDPDPLVSGRGIERLRSSGVEVTVGVGAAAVEQQLLPYLIHRRTGRPMVIVKLAASLDGRSAAPDGTSQWITGPQARLDVHRLRADSDAILVGARTVQDDDPSLTVRLDVGELPLDFVQPRRIVLGRSAATAKVQPALELSGPLPAILDSLGEQGVLQLLVEGGASVAHDFHQEGLVDRYVIYFAPALFGGSDGRGLFDGAGSASIDDLWRGQITSVNMFGADLRIDLVPNLRDSYTDVRSQGG